MTTFKNQILLDLADMMDGDVFAETITYDGVAILAIVDHEGDTVLLDKTREYNEIKGPDSAKIWVTKSAVPQVNQAAPVIIGGEYWMVDAELSSDGYLVSIRVLSAQMVTITRGIQSCTALATCRETMYTGTDVYGAFVSIVTRDYGLRASDYKPSGVTSKAELGDKITDNEGVFEVLIDGVPQFYYKNRSREQIIVHTKGK